jgi:hypothetical protein
MKYLDFVVEQATNWMRSTGPQGRKIVIDNTVDVYIFEKCITPKTIEVKGPGYYIGVDKIIVVSAENNKWRMHVFPIIVHERLKQDLIRILHKKYKMIMENQEQLNQEVTGIVACVSPDPNAIDTFSCQTSKFDRFSSAPYCGAKRICQTTEIPTGWTLIGEFHSHPLEFGERSKMLMAPPSDADLYQLLVASTKGEHNMSCVCAPEGIYFVSCTTRATRMFRHDMDVFFNSKEHAMMDCKQPIPSAVDKRLKYLHLLLHQPKVWFSKICFKVETGVFDMVEKYIELVRKSLYITIEFYPHK